MADFTEAELAYIQLFNKLKDEIPLRDTSVFQQPITTRKELLDTIIVDHPKFAGLSLASFYNFDLISINFSFFGKILCGWIENIIHCNLNSSKVVLVCSVSIQRFNLKLFCWLWSTHSSCRCWKIFLCFDKDCKVPDMDPGFLTASCSLVEEVDSMAIRFYSRIIFNFCRKDFGCLERQQKNFRHDEIFRYLWYAVDWNNNWNICFWLS